MMRAEVVGVAAAAEAEARVLVLPDEAVAVVERPCRIHIFHLGPHFRRQGLGTFFVNTTACWFDHHMFDGHRYQVDCL